MVSNIKNFSQRDIRPLLRNLKSEGEIRLHGIDGSLIFKRTGYNKYQIRDTSSNTETQISYFGTRRMLKTIARGKTTLVIINQVK